MGTREIRMGIRGIRVEMRGMGVGILGMQGIRVRMQEIRVGMRGMRGNEGDSSRVSSCLLLRLKSRSVRGEFHHLAFMGSWPTLSHTFFVLSTKWMSSPLRK